jgi:hypothetical protein
MDGENYCKYCNKNIGDKNKKQYCNKKCQRKDIIKRNKEFILKYKYERGCDICGYNKYPEEICFFHKDENNRKISDLIKSAYSIKEIQKEIAKCKLLCRYCNLNKKQL